jgi:uncharacterized membrane protein YeiH
VLRRNRLVASRPIPQFKGFDIQMYSEFPALLLPYLNLAGTAVFAASGSLAPARARQTPLTFVFFAVVTGIGGSTLSELLMGVPVTWIHHPTNIVVCLVVALVTWITPLAWWPNSAIDWFDAVGIAAYGTAGAASALSDGIPPLSAAILGVFTACLGGVFRDVLAGKPSIIVRPELYVTAAALAAGAYVALVSGGIEPTASAAVAFTMGFGLRAVAIVKRLSLPSYHGVSESILAADTRYDEPLTERNRKGDASCI